MKKVKRKRKPQKGKRATAFADPHPYDSAFKTLLVRITPFMAYVVNELFGTTYTDRAKITLEHTELVSRRPDGRILRRTMDSAFDIREGDASERVHIEMESSPDGSVRWRMFEYGSMDAYAHRKITPEGRAVARFPRSGLICLRPLSGRPAALELDIETSDGRALHRTPILYVDDYDLDMLKQKDLVFLAPFLLFRHANELDAINSDPSKLRALTEEFESLKDYYLLLCETGRLSTEQMAHIMEITRRVSDNLAAGHAAVRKEVDQIMGGEVWTLEVDRIKHDYERKVNKIKHKIADKERQLNKQKVELSDKERQLSDKDRQLNDTVRQLDAATEGIIQMGREAHFDDMRIVSQLQKSLSISKEEAQAILSEYR